jgi:hypothetical protein
MKIAAKCGGVEKDRPAGGCPDARRGRRLALAVVLDEDRLFDLMNEGWPDERPRKHYLGGGMVCLMHPGGEVSIKLKYRYQGKEQQLHLGELGNIPSDEIVAKYAEAKRLLQVGADPRSELIDDVAEALLANLRAAQVRLEDYVRIHFPKKYRRTATT